MVQKCPQIVQTFNLLTMELGCNVWADVGSRDLCFGKSTLAGAETD